MTFPETRVDLNRLIKKIKPELTSESFQIFKNSCSTCTDGRTDGRTGKVPQGVVIELPVAIDFSSWGYEQTRPGLLGQYAAHVWPMWSMRSRVQPRRGMRGRAAKPLCFYVSKENAEF